MTDSRTVWITNQKIGDAPTNEIAIPRSVFNRLVAFYEKPQKPIRGVVR